LVCSGNAALPDEILEESHRCTNEYADEVFRFLCDHGYDRDLYHLYVLGGGASLLKQYSKLPKKNVTLIEDIHANAKGYEFLYRLQTKRAVISK